MYEGCPHVTEIDEFLNYLIYIESKQVGGKELYPGVMHYMSKKIT